MLLVEVLDDGERLRETAPSDLEHRHQALGIQREIGRFALLAAAQMHEAMLGGQAFQVERDAHAVSGGRAKVIVKNHPRNHILPYTLKDA